MRIYIIRHGETQSNEKGLLQGWSNDPLNKMGVLLAEETGKAMKGLHFDAAFSSPLLRSKQTAEIILRESEIDAPLSFDDRIKEIGMGDYEMKRYRPGESEVDPRVIQTFLKNPLEAAFPNGESIRGVMARTQDFLKELAQKNYDSVLVFTHGCALRCMLNFLYDDPADFWHGRIPYNCCVNVVEAENGQMKLVEDDLVLYDKNLCVDHYASF